MDNDITGLINAIQAKAWYPLIAYAIAIIISVWSRWQPRLLEEVDGKPPILSPRIQWLPAVLIAGASAFIDGYFSGYTWQLALGLALYTMSTGGVGAVGVHRIRKEVGSSSAAVLLIMMFGFSQSGCSSFKPVLRTVHDVAKTLCALHHSKLQGMSLEDAYNSFCSTEELLRPWLDEALRLQQSGIAAPAESPQCGPEKVLLLVPVEQKSMPADAGLDSVTFESKE